VKNPPLRSFRAENFKAIRDSGKVELGWITVFIGDNGVGKSRLVEAMETFRDIVLDGVDSAFHRWRGFEHVWNKAQSRTLLDRIDHRIGYSDPLIFRFDWKQPHYRIWPDRVAAKCKTDKSLAIAHGLEHLYVEVPKPAKKRVKKKKKVEEEFDDEGADE